MSNRFARGNRTPSIASRRRAARASSTRATKSEWRRSSTSTSSLRVDVDHDAAAYAAAENLFRQLENFRQRFRATHRRQLRAIDVACESPPRDHALLLRRPNRAEAEE